MNLIIFGPPGAGKGTQADFIVKKYSLYQLSTGEVLRNEIKNKTELGKKISAIINDIRDEDIQMEYKTAFTPVQSEFLTLSNLTLVFLLIWLMVAFGFFS